MPSAREWASPENLEAELQRCNWESWFEKKRRDQKSLDDVVNDSVGSSTFRAFRRKGSNHPSVVYRRWAFHILQKSIALQRLRRIRSQNEYDNWLIEMCEDFKRCWDECLDPIYYGASLKLPNLLFKHLLAYREVTTEEFHRIVPFLHVPLDKYTILAFRKFSENFPPGQTLGKIPKHAGMGFIRDRDRYEKFQTAIREIAGKASCPPIAFDVLAWNKAHKNKKRR